MSSLLIVSALFAGCSATSSFMLSQHPEAATLTIFNKSAYPVRPVGFVEGEDCSGGRLIFNDQKILEVAKSATVKIDPDEIFSFYFYGKKPKFGYHCIVPASFVPKARARYVAVFDLINFSVPFESDAVIAETDIGIPPTDPSLGFTRFQQPNNPLWPPTEVAPCYVSVVRIENGEFASEPSFVARRWRQPVLSTSESQCY